MAGDLDELTRLVAAFRDARDWSQFHSLRNLIVSLNLEAGELLELTQWKTDAEIDALPADLHGREALEDECADVLLYLLLIADRAGIDLEAATRPSSPRTRPSIRWSVSAARAASTTRRTERPRGRRPGTEVLASRP
jgi:NTP pyrophosphatase (non-canonical NTP hydrolase)